MIARPDRRGLHEILTGVPGKPGAHENIENIMHMRLGLGQRAPQVIRQSAREVGMAAVVIGHTLQQLPCVGIAARADHVMHGAAICVDTIPIQGVFDDGGHRSEIRKA